MVVAAVATAAAVVVAAVVVRVVAAVVGAEAAAAPVVAGSSRETQLSTRQRSAMTRRRPRAGVGGVVVVPFLEVDRQLPAAACRARLHGAIASRTAVVVVLSSVKVQSSDW